MDNILITGTSKGIGYATACLFLQRGYNVIGFDKLPSTIKSDNYKHYVLDIRDKDKFPDLPDINILINNAGSQNDDDIDNNLKSAIYITEKYGISNNIKSILFNASASAHTGFEFPEYSASKAGMIGYMKNVAWRIAKYGGTCNSISCGGVITDLNRSVMIDKKLWTNIMRVTPLKKWATVDEIAEWIYFITVINKSMTGQDILIDNGEKDLNCTFIWPDFNNN